MHRSLSLALVALAVCVLGIFGLSALPVGTPANAVPVPLGVLDPCPHARPVPSDLQLPATVPPGEPIALEQKMLTYLRAYRYRALDWCVDKYVRDTGPYAHGEYFGTHPAVRIYYSPEMMEWLRRGRSGVPRDGAVIIKEQYAPPPAVRYEGLEDDALRPTDWTLMIRRSAASRDGWFWAELYTTPAMTFRRAQYPNAGFGIYCLRCHASANDAMTFSSLNNIKGFPGEPIAYKIDGSWRSPLPKPAPSQTLSIAIVRAKPQPEHEKNALHPVIVSRAPPIPIQTFPAEPLDDMLAKAPPQQPALFLPSTQCMGCHGAESGGPAGPLMWLTPSPSYSPEPSAPAGPAGVNVSEYGEWRWSPMGLAGRDPVFYAQLESELASLDAVQSRDIAGSRPQQTRDTIKGQIVDTCMRCHGVMGKRTNDLDHGPNAHFDMRWIFDADPAKGSFHYGGLARDGVSCTVCHHIAQTKEETASLPFVLNNRSTGLFSVGPPDRLQGPYHTETIAAHPMNASLGVKPVFGAIVTSARTCASCHSINLPIIDETGKLRPIAPAMAHDVEQNTYVEWVNSRYQTEYKPLPGARSCQDCHMSGAVDNDRVDVHSKGIQTKIALVQDQSYPRSEHRAPPYGIDVRFRPTGFRRHELLGLNAFLLRAFQENSDALGVRLNDYMSGSSTDLDDAIANVVRQAQHKTATVDLRAHIENGTLFADVGVTNETGHRFPSGVGFRRAWIELAVSDAAAKPLWVSGGTNARGEIVEGEDPAKILPSEYFVRGADGKQQYQQHFDLQHPITRPGEVQIFEELVQDQHGYFTESFVRRDRHVKDNRLLPQGWKRDGPPGVLLPRNWLDATRPEGEYVTTDPNYANGSGRAVTAYRIPLGKAPLPARLRVAATLWYQSWEPAFRRARTSGNGPAATRLRVLLGNLDLQKSPLADWKLKIGSAFTTVSPAQH